MSKAKLQEAEIGEGMVFVYIRDNQWNSLCNFCGDFYSQTNDPVYIFWKAFAIYNMGDPNGAINELHAIHQKKEIAYACIVALIYYQNQVQNIDREEIDSLRAKERNERRNGADKAAIQAILFFTFIKQFSKASDLLTEKDNGSPLFKMAQITYYLMNVEEQDKEGLEKMVDQFYQEKDKNTPRLLIFLARSMVKNTMKKYEDALNTLNEGIVFYPKFTPFYTEKLVALMSEGDWEEFHGTALEVSQKENNNIQALRALTFYELAREGNIESAFMRIRELQSAIEKKEGKNAKLLYENAQIFLRVCGRNQKIVELLQSIVNKCRKYDPLNADYAIEQGHQFLVLKNSQQAYKCFQQAASLDESKLESITGMIECKLMQEEIEDAENQIEFMNVMQQTVGRTPMIAYVQAMLTIRKPNQTNQSRSEFYKLLDGALKMQITYSKTLTPGFTYYIKLNPNFLFAIAELYLAPVSIKEMLEGNENPNPTSPIGKGIKLLESITRQIPGFLPAYLLLAKGKLAVGNELDASLAIAKVLHIDSRCEQGSIISAMIKNKKKDYPAALNSLQEAISINFKIRENLLFMLLKGEIEYEMKDYQTAEETMSQAIALPVAKKKVVGEGGKSSFQILNFTEKDRCSLFLLLAKCYAKNKKQKESKSVMTQAIQQFSGTTEQDHVGLANAEIAVEVGDIKKAMSILKQVKGDSTYYVQSRKILADIHLNCLKSRKGYARCYFEIIENTPTFQNYKIYGDALVRINEPEEASVAYEKAYEQKSDNELIIRDLGRAYALAHDYAKATKFYEDNIEKLNRPDLILDLAKLCIQLKKYDRAQQLLTNPMFSEESDNYEKLKQNVDAHHQLYLMELKKQGSNDFSPNEKARKYIKMATQFHKMVIEKLRAEGSSGDEEKGFYANLYFQIAEYTNKYQKNVETAILMLKQCLKVNEEHEKALQLLAELQLREGRVEESQTLCNILLKVNPKNDMAGSILAEIMLKSNQYDKAIEQFRSMLEEEPGKYAVLAKLIDFFRRNNELENAKTYIEAAQNKASNANDSGLCYCRGLYHKYARSPTDALIEFNKAKKSSQYAESSLGHMIDIFLAPGQELYYSAIEGKTKAIHPENVRICQSLLREMKNRASFHKFEVFDCLVTMMKGNYRNIDEVISRLVEVLTNRSQYPPAMLVMAIAKFLAKKDVEGNNFLKLLAKMNYQPEFGEEMEKGWLLQAESYIQIKKYDSAEDVLRMLLKENKSCDKAQELMGLIKEKEQAYADASEHYEKAFTITSRKSASIGYRLAYNYFKAKRYVDCLEVCRQVLEANPGYTAIKADIQEKAIMAIR